MVFWLAPGRAFQRLGPLALLLCFRSRFSAPCSSRRSALAVSSCLGVPHSLSLSQNDAVQCERHKRALRLPLFTVGFVLQTATDPEAGPFEVLREAARPHTKIVPVVGIRGGRSARRVLTRRGRGDEPA